MIQRIQTLFLIIALGLMVTLFFTEFGTFYPFAILTGLSCLCLIATILCFKMRKIQIRLCIYNSLILLGLQIWMGAVYIKNMDSVPFGITTVFPIVCIILLVLAMRYIGRDEALVQSYNRLRPQKGASKKTSHKDYL